MKPFLLDLDLSKETKVTSKPLSPVYFEYSALPNKYRGMLIIFLAIFKPQRSYSIPYVYQICTKSSSIMKIDCQHLKDNEIFTKNKILKCIGNNDQKN